MITELHLAAQRGQFGRMCRGFSMISQKMIGNFRSGDDFDADGSQR
ncbi:hypothetical protein NC653_026628 [Populus alba x Populus x berolinensis]|uniref:Uncharacterized protein n=1 Tax=Populus alba x Populus x berolinensis TaxID=444605 RepID=A0AAD6MEL0_9ROSI|nr:hypothetical protein NC653_026628 [Populus alba x Populus x berolinensis]